MMGTIVEWAVEHLSSILDNYTTVDLDTLARGEIAATIKSLERFQKRYRKDVELEAVRGLVARIISHLYIARGHATTDLPRHFDYYQNMNLARGLIEQINSLGEDE